MDRYVCFKTIYSITRTRLCFVPLECHPIHYVTNYIQRRQWPQHKPELLNQGTVPQKEKKKPRLKQPPPHSSYLTSISPLTEQKNNKFKVLVGILGFHYSTSNQHNVDRFKVIVVITVAEFELLIILSVTFVQFK